MVKLVVIIRQEKRDEFALDKVVELLHDVRGFKLEGDLHGRSTMISVESGSVDLVTSRLQKWCDVETTVHFDPAKGDLRRGA